MCKQTEYVFLILPVVINISIMPKYIISEDMKSANRVVLKPRPTSGRCDTIKGIWDRLDLLLLHYILGHIRGSTLVSLPKRRLDNRICFYDPQWYRITSPR